MSLANGSTPLDEIKGEWKGAFIMNAHVVNFNVYISSKGQDLRAMIDIPSQDIFDIPNEVSIEGENICLRRTNKKGILIELVGELEGKVFSGDYHYNSEYLKGKPGVFQLMKSSATIVKGEVLPPFSIASIDENRTFSENAFKGKVLLIDFWATWCPPCVAKRPKLEAIKQKYGSSIEILSVSLDTDIEKVRQFMKDKYAMDWHHSIKTEQWKDPFIKKFVPTGLPYGYLVDKKGNVIAFGNELGAKTIEKTVDRIMKAN